MFEGVRWIRLLAMVAVGFVVGFLAGDWALALSTGAGFLLGGLLFEVFWRPRMEARLERKYGDDADAT